MLYFDIVTLMKFEGVEMVGQGHMLEGKLDA